MLKLRLSLATILLFAITALAIPTAALCAQDLPPQGAIASAHPLATEAGLEILRQGGNAFDAAIAVTATLGVVEPYGSGIGGGGFWLLHRQADHKQVMIDGREMAPGRASRDMYLDAQGNVRPNASIDGPLAAGIPGVPAAMAHIALHYGKLPLAESLAPAIRIAKNGFKVDDHYRRFARFRLKVLQANAETARIFLHEQQVPEEGYLLKQPDLARTLELIASSNAQKFYQGPFAEKLAKAVTAAGGIWSADDLRRYKVVERKPIQSHYHDMKIISAAPPSSGGIALAEMVNMLSQFKLAAMPGAQQKHLIIEAMRRAYRDRAEYLGDSDFIDVPIAKLTSPGYARQLVQSIKPDQATSNDELRPVADPTGKGADTTHFSILDKAGNRVAATLSVNYLFGSAFVVPGSGFLLNDEMDDFSAKPGVPNVYGLVGAEANAIAPYKRPLSSMSPTFLESERGISILGTPGGSRIITMVLLGALEFARGGDASAMVDLPRFHHQYLPDVVMFEDGALSEEEQTELNLQGYVLKKQKRPYGNMHAIVWDQQNRTVTAASDKRGIGLALTY